MQKGNQMKVTERNKSTKFTDHAKYLEDLKKTIKWEVDEFVSWERAPHVAHCTMFGTDENCNDYIGTASVGGYGHENDFWTVEEIEMLSPDFCPDCGSRRIKEIAGEKIICGECCRVLWTDFVQNHYLNKTGAYLKKE